MHVNAGDGLFGGNWDDRSFLIHTGYGRGVLRDGFLEEVLFHEGAHVSLDGVHASAPGWRAARQADGGFISDYARDNPEREDVAESVLPYFAVRYVPGRLSRRQREAIEAAIPNRLRYFDEQGLDWTPYVPAVSGPAATVSFEQPTYTATERGAAAEVDVLLSAPVDRVVTIPLNTDPAGGVSEADYTFEAVAPARIAPPADAAHSGRLDLTFPADTTTATLTVTALEDPEDDPGELHIVILEDGLPSDVDQGASGHTVVEFREHDPVTVSFAQARHTTAEGETAEVVLRLSAPVNREVTIPLNTDPAGLTEADYTLEAVAPARIAPPADAAHSGRLDLTFPADTTTATLTVTALEDPEDDPGELHIVILKDGLPSYVNEGCRTAPSWSSAKPTPWRWCRSPSRRTRPPRAGRRRR